MPPPIEKIIETALHVEDTVHSAKFYERVLGLRVMGVSERIATLDVGGNSVLLLFQKGGSVEPTVTPGGIIPPNDAQGQMHLAFAIGGEAYEDWKNSLQENRVEIESEVIWSRGGRSIYFRDPDGHNVELATPGIWEIY